MTKSAPAKIQNSICCEYYNIHHKKIKVLKKINGEAVVYHHCESNGQKKNEALTSFFFGSYGRN